MQDTRIKKGDVIIFGGDHHNGLGLARILGMNGFRVYSVVENAHKRSWLKYSKYIYQSNVFSSYKEGLDFILKNYALGNKNAVLIPYSDGAALEVDNRLDELKNLFFVPSINNKAGEISNYMSKQRQYDFAKTHRLKMANSFTYYFDNKENFERPNFPCILKPVVSAEGNKQDIVICKNTSDYEFALEKLKLKGYRRIVVQDFIDFDYEIDVFGCICKNEPYENIVPTKTIRSFPPQKGTNSFSEIVVDETIVNKCKVFVDALRGIGFYGLYDIELFVKGEDVWLNEINFRNSGDVYMAIKQGFYYPVVWVNDALGYSNKSTLIHPKKHSFAMTELSDVRNVFNGQIPLLSWMRDLKKVDDFAVLFKGDMKPLFYKLFFGLKSRFLR